MAKNDPARVFMEYTKPNRAGKCYLRVVSPVGEELFDRREAVEAVTCLIDTARLVDACDRIDKLKP